MSRNSATKLTVIKTTKHPFGGSKAWVRVELLRSRVFWPSFRDLWRIIQAIASCEDDRYPPPAKGRQHLAEFLHDAVHERNFGALAAKYKIPERDGDQIVNTNGARIDPPSAVPAPPVVGQPPKRHSREDAPPVPTADEIFK